VPAFDAGFERESISIGTVRAFRVDEAGSQLMEIAAPEKVWFQPLKLPDHPCLSSRASFSSIGAVEDWHEDVPGQ
jgi:hypothetical protein